MFSFRKVTVVAVPITVSNEFSTIPRTSTTTKAVIWNFNTSSGHFYHGPPTGEYFYGTEILGERGDRSSPSSSENASLPRFPRRLSLWGSPGAAWANCLSRDILALLSLSRLITRGKTRILLRPLYVSFGGEAADFTSVRSSKHSIHRRTLVPVTMSISTLRAKHDFQIGQEQVVLCGEIFHSQTETRNFFALVPYIPRTVDISSCALGNIIFTQKVRIAFYFHTISSLWSR